MDLAVLEQQAQIVNDKGSAMLVAVQAFRAAKVAGLTPTAAQRAELKTAFADAFTAVKSACAAIDAELAKG